MSSQSQRDLFGQPAWNVAQLFPNQGNWSEIDYLGLTTNHLIELSDGILEVLAMPTEMHQEIVLFLYQKLSQYIQPRKLGKLLVAPMRIRLWEGKFREPDLVFMLAENRSQRTSKYWNGADLVIEVVSPDDPDRDLILKRTEYASAGISEYWIVDPRDRTIRVLVLDKTSKEYRDSDVYADGAVAGSRLLLGFEVSVSSVFTID